MADIKKLLSKKGWTGRELGIIEISNMCSVFSQRMSGVQNPVPLVTKAQFQTMLNSIQDRYQAKIYSGYMSIHEWLSLYYNVCNSHTQQAQFQFTKLADVMERAIQAEDLFQYIEGLPLIMTPQQYEDEKAKGRKLWLEDHGDNLLALVFRAFEYYAKLLATDPKKPNPLKPIRKKYLAEPISSPIIKARYNEAVEHGYYLLEDGRRSDQMTDEEWKAAVTAPAISNAVQQAAIAGSLKPTLSIPGLDTDDIATHDLINRANILYRGGSYEDVRQEQEERRKRANPTLPFTFQLYEDLPEDLNKWDFLMDGCAVYEVYYNSVGSQGTEEEYAEEATDFVAEFADMVKAMLQDIDESLGKGTGYVLQLPIQEWQTTVIEWEYLYEHNLYGIREETDRTDILFDGNNRAMFNGIAIIDPASGALDKVRNIDDNGYYVPPQIQNTYKSTSLEAYFTDAEHYAEKVDELERSRAALLESYYFLKAFNLALDMVADHFDLPDIVKCFSTPVAGIEAKMDALNELIPILYLRIRDTQYEDKELQQKKLQVLQDIFTAIDYKSLEIPAEKIEQVRALFEDFKAFKDNAMDDILFYREPTGEEVADDE